MVAHSRPLISASIGAPLLIFCFLILAIWSIPLEKQLLLLLEVSPIIKIQLFCWQLEQVLGVQSMICHLVHLPMEMWRKIYTGLAMLIVHTMFTCIWLMVDVFMNYSNKSILNLEAQHYTRVDLCIITESQRYPLPGNESHICLHDKARLQLLMHSD